MIDRITLIILWFNAIGCGLMAGLYFAFSAFIMTALGAIEPRSGIASMNAINDKILRSWFMPLFWGTTLASAVLAVIGFMAWSDPAMQSMVAGGLIYIVGMFVCTIAFNVPLNNALVTAGAADSAVWEHYLRNWTRWNHVRTIACTVACGLFIHALGRIA